MPLVDTSQLNRRNRHLGRPTNGIVPGRHRTGGAWTGCGARRNAMTGHTSTTRICWSRRAAPESGPCSARRRAAHRTVAGDSARNPRRVRSNIGDRAGVRSWQRSQRASRPGVVEVGRGSVSEPFPKGMGGGDHRRSQIPCRLARAESEPDLMALRSIARIVVVAALEIGGTWLVWHRFNSRR